MMSGKTQGGKLIDYGGYGCVFYPALKCKNRTRKQGTSKLMFKEYGDREYKDLTKFGKILKKIPNYQHFFIGPETVQCKNPEKFTKDDLENMEKCRPLMKKNVKPGDVNKNLKRFTFLDMTYGGMTMDTYLYNLSTYDELLTLNNSLIDLFENGIMPMNNRGVVHNDIKGANIVIDSKGICRLIDWGLSGIIDKNSSTLEIKHRPIQYNVPYSSVLLCEDRQNIINAYLEQTQDYSRKNCHFIALYILDKEYDKRDKLSNTLEEIYSHIYGEAMKKDVKNFLKYDIVNYLGDIIVNHITHNGKIEVDMDKYINEIYRYNADTWGFLTCYVEILERVISLDKRGDGRFHEFIINTTRPLNWYLYSSEWAAIVIPRKEIVSMLRKLLEPQLRFEKPYDLSKLDSLKDSSSSVVEKSDMKLSNAMHFKKRKAKHSPNGKTRKQIHPNILHRPTQLLLRS